MFQQYIKAQLKQREESGLIRNVQMVNPSSARLIEVDSREYINFATNDYLGLAADSTVEFGTNPTACFSGSMASPLVTGYHQIHQKLEQQILTLVDAPEDYACILFSSGFAANAGVIKALFNTKDSNALLFQDRLNHASLLDSGVNCQGLGHCRQWRYKHNDIDHLNELITTKGDSQSRRLIVTEGVFSMDGDAPNLAATQVLAARANSLLMIDDAHGIGVLGTGGSGSLSEQRLSIADVDIYVVTFGKAIGAQGAAVIAPKYLIDYFINFSKEFIYSTHLSPIQTYLVSHNLEKLSKQSWRQEKLHENIQYFKSLMAQTQLKVLTSDSAIQPIMVGNEQQALALSESLKKRGIWLTAIRYPTVSKGAARLRLTLTTAHSKQDIKFLVDTLVDTVAQCDVV